MGTYEEALAKQRGVMSNAAVMEANRERKRRLIGIRTYVKPEIPAGVTIYLAMDDKKQMSPCAHIMLGQEQGDLLHGQIALIGPSDLPTMEIVNDNQERL